MRQAGAILMLLSACGAGCAWGPSVAPRRGHTEPDVFRPGPVSRSPAAAPLATEASGVVKHRVLPGQTVYRITKIYGVTQDALCAANGIKDARISVGQELIIPIKKGAAAAPARVIEAVGGGADGAPIENNELPGLSVPTRVSWGGSAVGAGGGSIAASRREPPSEGAGSKSASSRNESGTRGTGSRGGTSRDDSGSRDDPSRDPPRASYRAVSGRAFTASRTKPLRWPLRGVLYGRFGRRGQEPHDGIDLAAPAGTPVLTSSPGTVLYAGVQKGYGNIVIVEHQNGFITLYAHNRDVRVKSGQRVREGQVLATVGDSGKTSGPHLHFEVRVDGKPMDPLRYLGPIGEKT